jgi:DNA-directed RNA polymerase specialized sigma24 family protein
MASTDETTDRQRVDRALRELDAARPHAPSGPAVLELVTYLAPVIQNRVTRVLLAYGRDGDLNNLGALVDEQVQSVFGKLFEDRAHVLRLWDEAGGLSLRNWVGRFATLRSKDSVRSAKRDPRREEAQPPEFFEQSLRGAGSSDGVEAAELWTRVRAAVEAELSDRGRELLHLMFDRDASTVEIREATGLADDAIFQWRRRLRVAIHQALDQQSAEAKAPS